ncbi:hypothetical protein Tco_0372327, partial [Tanacetum coccineum]
VIEQTMARSGTNLKMAKLLSFKLYASDNFLPCLEESSSTSSSSSERTTRALIPLVDPKL